MKTYITLLRGINVSGQNRIRMPELKRLYESLNLINVVTYIQSGNVIFDCAKQDPAALAKAIEAELERSFGLIVRVILRDSDRLQQIIDNNPFANQRKEDLEKLHVTFLAKEPSEEGLRFLRSTGGDCFPKEHRDNVATTALPKKHRDDVAGGAREERLTTTPNTDEFVIKDQEIYLFCPNGYGKTKLSNSFFERKMGVAATTRKWKTVNTLCEMANQR